jgi:hypothetical protein
VGIPLFEVVCPLFFYPFNPLYLSIMKTIVRTFKCEIYDNWMAGLEYAYLTITTPKGTTLRFDKWPPAKLKNKWNENEEVSKLVWRIYGEAQTGWIHLTKDEVLLLKNYSNLQDVDLIKLKVRAFKRGYHK